MSTITISHWRELHHTLNNKKRLLLVQFLRESGLEEGLAWRRDLPFLKSILLVNLQQSGKWLSNVANIWCMPLIVVRFP